MDNPVCILCGKPMQLQSQWYLCQCGVWTFLYADKARLIQVSPDDGYIIPPGCLMLVGKESPL